MRSAAGRDTAPQHQPATPTQAQFRGRTQHTLKICSDHDGRSQPSLVDMSDPCKVVVFREGLVSL
eukprot:2499475-Rhodomonas_salina.1